MPTHKLIAITPGEPAGIGPDITLMLAQYELPAIPVAIADPALLQQRANQLEIQIDLQIFDSANPPEKHKINLLHVLPIKIKQKASSGSLNPINAAYVLETLQQAVLLCQKNTCHALVTGPIHKACIIESGYSIFTGHTEFLGELTTAKPLMMLATNTLRVALVTTHIPLSAVSSAITPERLTLAIEILHRDLIRLFDIDQPRIAVTGLNPHAGEQGHLGHEEKEIIEPVVNKLRQQGMQLLGPLPADTAFTPNQLKHCDAVLTMYHDQGLPTLKHAGFGQAVNITLGLPIIRTSVDHGTALALAGTGKADPNSLLTAFKLAARLKNIGIENLKH